jgi:extradiol dioxygenase family protein
MSGGAVFHLAFFVTDLAAARRFYVDLLGCAEGRSTDTWVDFDFFGHQLSAHLGEPSACADCGRVDGVAVPIPHFGAVLDWDRFHALAERLAAGGARFLLAPQLRYAGQPAEQMTMFVADPAGNALELKAFRRPERIFEP